MAIYYPERVRALLLTPVDLSTEGLSDLYRDETKDLTFPKELEAWWKTLSAPAEEDLSRIHTPTIFVIGENEQHLKRDHIAWQYQSIPEAKVVWIPDADH